VPAEQAGEDKTTLPNTSYTLIGAFRVRLANKSVHHIEPQAKTAKDSGEANP